MPGPKTSRFIVLAAICVVVAALYFAQDVLIPLALAMLLSFLLSPLVQRLERWKLGRVPSVIIAVILLFGLIGVLGYVVGRQMYDLASNLDQYKGNIAAKVEALRPRGGGMLEKIERNISEVKQGIDEPEKAAATQSTQPAKRLANPPAIAQAGFAAPTPQWTRDHPLPVANVEPKGSPFQALGTSLAVLLGPLGTAGIVVVFTIFILLQREDLRNRLLRLIAGGQITVATQALDDATTRISRYLLAQAAVNGTYGVAISLGLWIIGLTLGRNDPSGTGSFPNVVLWGLLCGLLRFIPYIGPWIGAAFPLLISLAVYKHFQVFIATGLLFVGIELFSNNFMEPLLYGSSTGMSAVAILVSAVFWTWLWGPIGLLLATPLTVMLVVLGKYVPQLQFLDVLLGDEPVLDPPTLIYQRLIALDAEEATELLEQYRQEMPLERVYDDVLLPALAQAEQDRAKGLLDDRRQLFIRRSMRDIIEELGDQERLKLASEQAAGTNPEPRADRVVEAEATTGGDGHPSAPLASEKQDQVTGPSRLRKMPHDCTINIVCLPAHDEADEIADLMLAQLLELRGYCAHSVSQTALVSEMIEQIDAKHADVVVVSALPPGAVAHARYLCKRVHARYPDTKMAVGLWHYGGDLNKAKDRITCVASVQLVTKLAEIQDVIDQLAQSAMVRVQDDKVTR